MPEVRNGRQCILDFFICKMSDEKTTSLLIEWGFEKYVDVFKENGVDARVLLLLEDEQLRKLIPKIGPHLKFKKLLSDFKSSQKKVQGPGVQKQIYRYIEHPSVVERNARIIKWLSQSQNTQRSCRRNSERYQQP